MQKLLVPIDFSPASQAACSMAGTFVHLGAHDITLLHVWESPAYLTGDTMLHQANEPSQSLINLAIHRAQEQMNVWVSRCEEAWGTKPKAFIEMGTPWRKICAFSEAEGCDLIILGSHDRGPVMKLILGSVGEHVVRHAHCATLIARSKRAHSGSLSEAGTPDMGRRG